MIWWAPASHVRAMVRFGLGVSDRVYLILGSFWIEITIDSNLDPNPNLYLKPNPNFEILRYYVCECSIWVDPYVTWVRITYGA